VTAIGVSWTITLDPVFAQSWTPEQKKYVKKLERKQEKLSWRLLDIQKVGKQLNKLKKWRQSGMKGSKPGYDVELLRKVLKTERRSKSLRNWRKNWDGAHPSTSSEKLARVDQLVSALHVRYKWLEKQWEELDHQIKNPGGVVMVSPGGATVSKPTSAANMKKRAELDWICRELQRLQRIIDQKARKNGDMSVFGSKEHMRRMELEKKRDKLFGQLRRSDPEWAKARGVCCPKRTRQEGLLGVKP
jgi:hypothetical protein